MTDRDLADSFAELANAFAVLSKAAEKGLRPAIRSTLAGELGRLRIRVDAMAALSGVAVDAPALSQHGRRSAELPWIDEEVRSLCGVDARVSFHPDPVCRRTPNDRDRWQKRQERLGIGIVLSPQQSRLIGALLTCRRINDACRKANVSPRTYRVWKRQDEFLKALADAQRQEFQGAIGTLKAAAALAVRVLVQSMKGGRDDQQVKAALGVLGLLFSRYRPPPIEVVCEVLGLSETELYRQFSTAPRPDPTATNGSGRPED